MSLGRERCFFAGANTTEGFVDYFKDIIKKDEREVYILKGGPGTGKSQMMKKISQTAILEGYDVEIIKCSSDPDSLDGIRIPELKKTMVDGTAPHVYEADLPGIRDNVINLGEFWNEDKIRRNRDEISAFAENKSFTYKRIYNYLRAIKSIQDDIENIADRAIVRGKLNIFTKDVINNLFYDVDISYKTGYSRRMFGTAVTPKGNISMLNTLFRDMKVYALKAEFGRVSCNVIEEIEKEAVKRGFFVESLKCPLAPERTEHLIIPKISTVFTTYNKNHTEMECDVFGEYMMDVYYNDFLAEPYSDDIEYDSFRIQELINKVQRNLEKVSEIHKNIEHYYIAAMNFDGINKLTDSLKERIFN